MKKTIVLVAVSLLTTNMAFAKQNALTLTANAINYHCDNKTQMQVKYYNSDDQSISIAKFNFKGEEKTLFNVVSADGARYIDAWQKLEWWPKDREATLNEDITDKKSKLVTCKEVATAQKK